jgi:hypothetical protein
VHGVVVGPAFFLFWFVWRGCCVYLFSLRTIALHISLPHSAYYTMVATLRCWRCYHISLRFFYPSDDDALVTFTPSPTLGVAPASRPRPMCLNHRAILVAYPRTLLIDPGERWRCFQSSSKLTCRSCRRPTRGTCRRLLATFWQTPPLRKKTNFVTKLKYNFFATHQNDRNTAPLPS